MIYLLVSLGMVVCMIFQCIVQETESFNVLRNIIVFSVIAILCLLLWIGDKLDEEGK